MTTKEKRAKYAHLKPVPKVAAGGIGGAVAILVVFVCNEVGVDPPAPEVTTAIGTVATFAAAYIKR